MGLAPETLHHAYLLNALWYLVDVTEENGATRIYPGSHNKNVAPPAINTTVRLHLQFCVNIHSSKTLLLHHSDKLKGGFDRCCGSCWHCHAAG
jgi:hypothetical protein